ncbi:MAG: hypothetical protein AAFV33_26305, partial [Chloroflexota bacterium]
MPQDIASAAADTAFAKIKDAVPAVMLEAAREHIRSEALDRAFHDLGQNDVQFAGVAMDERTEEQQAHQNDALEKFQTATDISSFKALGGTPLLLSDCLMAGILAPQTA